MELYVEHELSRIEFPQEVIDVDEEDSNDDNVTVPSNALLSRHISYPVSYIIVLQTQITTSRH